jgi:hypothetical protein
MRSASALVIALTLTGLAFGQRNDGPQTASTDCTFEDGRQISIQYNPGKGEEPHNGKLWFPGGSPMIFFAGAPLTLSSSSIAPGAYMLYVVPGKKEWMLVVNKNVTVGTSYDPAQDTARGPMEIGEIDQQQSGLHLAFAHMAPKLCSLRLYYGKQGAFVDFKEQ